MNQPQKHVQSSAPAGGKPQQPNPAQKPGNPAAKPGATPAPKSPTSAPVKKPGAK